MFSQSGVVGTSLTIPAEVLQPGTTYDWVVIAVNSLSSTQSARWSFTTAGASCPGDFDGDGQIAAIDLALLLSCWGKCPSLDLTGDGIVNAIDLALLLSMWGPCP